MCVCVRERSLDSAAAGVRGAPTGCCSASQGAGVRHWPERAAAAVGGPKRGQVAAGRQPRAARRRPHSAGPRATKQQHCGGVHAPGGRPWRLAASTWSQERRPCLRKVGGAGPALRKLAGGDKSRERKKDCGGGEGEHKKMVWLCVIEARARAHAMPIILVAAGRRLCMRTHSLGRGHDKGMTCDWPRTRARACSSEHARVRSLPLWGRRAWRDPAGRGSRRPSPAPGEGGPPSHPRGRAWQCQHEGQERSSQYTHLEQGEVRADQTSV